MSSWFNHAARRLGIVSSIGVVSIEVLYMITLAAGFLSLQSPLDPIGDPYFTLLEILIILMMPFVVTIMVAASAWAPAGARVYGLTAVAFAVLLAGFTTCLHFGILTLSRQEAFAGLPWLPLVVSFRWPSVAYAVDILAWDIFFPLSVLFAAPVFRGSGLVGAVRVLLIASGVLALAGLSGVVLNDMQYRNIGIIGYTIVFAAAAVLMAVLFARTQPRED